MSKNDDGKLKGLQGGKRKIIGFSVRGGKALERPGLKRQGMDIKLLLFSRNGSLGKPQLLHYHWWIFPLKRDGCIHNWQKPARALLPHFIPRFASV